jgi:hypothetical protein
MKLYAFLMLSALAYSVNIPVSDLSINRASVAYDADFAQVAADTARTETRLVASREVPEVDTSASRVVVGVDGDTILAYSGGVLYKVAASAFSTSGTTWTTVVNVGSDDSGGANIFAPYRNGGTAGISGLQVVGSGVWIVGTSEDATSNNSDGHLFKTADAGQTWTHVLTMSVGNMPAWESMGQYGDTLIVGTYGPNPSDTVTPENSAGHDRVYLSDDLGDTWTLIYERDDYGTYGTDDPHPSGTHVHACQMIDADTALVQFGDAIPRSYGENDLLLKLTRPSSGTMWDKTVVRQYGANPVQLLRDGGYIYLGRDTGYGGAIERYDSAAGTIETVLDWPSEVGSFNTSTGVFTPNTAAPQRIDQGSTNLFSIIKSGNVIYACNWALSPFQQSGIVASVDGSSWAWVYREAAGATTKVNFGTRYIRGVASGYIWGTYYDEAGANYAFRMSTPTLTSKAFVRLEHGSTNLLNDIETTASGWTPLYRFSATNCGRVLASSEGITALRGDYVYKLQSDNTSASSSGVVLSPFASSKPSAGDYVVAKMAYKTSGSFNRLLTGIMRIEDPSSHLGTQQYAIYQATDEWRVVTMWAKCLSDFGTDAAPRLYIQIKPVGTDISAGPEDYYTVSDADWLQSIMYLDCISLTYSSGWHDSTSWQVAGTARTDEYATLDLTGYTYRDTVLFDWLPDTSSTELFSDIGIASVTDGSSTLDVFWDQSEGKLSVTDGVTTTGITCNFAKLDRVRIGLTRLQDHVRLFVLTTKYAGANLYPAVDLGEFTALELGRTSTPTYGIGLYGGLKVDKAMTESEIAVGRLDSNKRTFTAGTGTVTLGE